MSFNCVLLIDDDGIANFISHRLIKKLNITSNIQSATNGNEALKFIQNFALSNNNQGPELIFLDINMPVLDGFEFLEHIQKLNLSNKESIKIFMLTTSTNQKDIQKISGYNNVGYFNKPLTEDKLKDILKDIS